MQTKRRAFGRQHRLWAMALAVVLTCIPMMGTASAAPVTGAVILPEEAAPSATVSIVGNVVVDKGKPTGFYELSLRVKTARTITKVVDGNVTKVEEAEYLAAIEADPDSANEYTITNYPFQSAAAAVWINLDALTAVTWESGKPIYSTWNATSSTGGTYIPDHANPTDAEKAKLNEYPRGIDTTNTDQPKIFTDLKLDQLAKGEVASVRLDAAHPDVMTNATALVEKVQGNYALLTLTANTTTTKNVVYSTETPVVVVRFAYDMNRFTKLDVGDTKVTPPEPNESSFWVGLDRGAGSTGGPKTDQTALTWLAAGEPTMGDNRYAASDKAAADSSAQQAVWYAQNLVADDMTQQETHFYYYLGADGVNGGTTPAAQQDRQSYQVVDGTLKTPSLLVPKTEGKVVLAKKSAGYENPRDPETNEEYSFFQNLLEFNKTLKMYAENAETYRKPTGGGGTTILFYDWDDSLIGSLVVDKGDVRAEVNEYIETNLVHPDLRASKLLTNGKVPEEGDANRAAYTELVDSLARDYTYRGKYAYTVGDPDVVGENGDTDNKARADGEDYPLTNKLDYAFYRHVNRVVEQEDATSHTKTNYYSTSSLLDANNADAALYPYVYGWAVVEDTTKTNNWKVMYDAAKTEGVWTTIGVGELSDVKPNAAGTALPSGLTIDDVTEPGFIAYETAKAIKKGEDVAVPTTYQYTTASNAANKYFRFADFSDIDSELARYKKANGGNKDTLVVKAVYEPGPELLTNISYRLYDNPAYNKLNDLAAANGGAYSVEVTMERASKDTGNVQGVTRVREPAVRQDTTVDQKWIQDNALGVDHNLNNATIKTAKGLTETTYTKVDVDNGELVTFTMSLSARQNKVDYFIIEQYGNNFVSGAQRSQTNYGRQGAECAVDNYNYFVNGDSNEQDDYYDPKDYGDRDGSHGFVLYGTLNNLMQIATQYNNSELTDTRLYQVINYSNMRDANLCSDSAGTLAAPNREAIMRDKILAAAKDCKENHYGDSDFWNNKLDCAELTYHQLQWYIIDGVLYDRDTADGKLLTFCHLHTKCADLTSTKPKTWDELVAAGRDHPEYIDQLSVTEIEEMTHLRNSANGSAFANVAVFKRKFTDAVQAGNESWVDIQQAILNGTGSVDTYWWFDGSTSNPAPTTLAALGQRAQSALHEQAYPDGVSRTTLSKIESARATFNANATAGDNKVATAWIRMTNNLVKAHQETAVGDGDDMEYIYTHTKFDTFEEFRDAYLAALNKAEEEGYGYGTDMTQPKWEGIQNSILHPSDAYNNDADGADDADFWWKDGKTPLRVTSIGTLLKAAQYVNSGTEDEKAVGEAALAKVTVAMLEGEPFWLRSTMQGLRWSEDTDDPMTDEEIRDLVKAAQRAGATDWNTLQYYLIHGKLEEDKKTMLNEAFYYWWVKGGEGTEIDFSEAVTLNIVIAQLQEAALRGDRFGDPKAKDSVTAQMVDGSFYDLTHLTPTDPTTMDPEATTVDDMVWYTDTDTLLGMITDMVTFMKTQQGIEGDYSMPFATWHQVQHWILHPTEYIEDETPPYDQAVEDYWWYDKTEKPKEDENKKNPERSDGLADAILAWCDDEDDATLKGTITYQNLWGTYGIYTTTSGGKYTSKNISTGKTRLANLAKAVKSSEYYDAENKKLTLYWAQIQYYWVNQTLVDNKTALTAIVNDWKWSKPGGGGSQELIPDEVDLSVLD